MTIGSIKKKLYHAKFILIEICRTNTELLQMYLAVLYSSLYLVPTYYTQKSSLITLLTFLKSVACLFRILLPIVLISLNDQSTPSSQQWPYLEGATPKPHRKPSNRSHFSSSFPHGLWRHSSTYMKICLSPPYISFWQYDWQRRINKQ